MWNDPVSFPMEGRRNTGREKVRKVMDPEGRALSRSWNRESL